MSQLNSNKKGCGCLTITGAFLLGILGGGYLLSQVFLGKELTPANGAKIIPDEAILTSYFSTDAQDWSKLSKFGTPEAKQIINENWQNFTKDLTKNNQNIDYQKDIEPWLGGIMLTALPSTQNSNFVTILGIKNKFKAWQFMQKLKKQPDSKITESKYKNITVYNINDNQGNILWATFFKNYVVVSDNEQNVQVVIDTFKGETSLATKTKSSNLFSQKLNLKNPVAQIYLPDYDQLMKEALDDPNYSQNLPPETQQKLKDIGSLVMGIGIEDQGIHLQAITNFVTPIDQNLLKPVSDRLISQMPNNTILLVNGQGINQLWTEVEKQTETIPELDEAISQWEYSLKNYLDLDLGKDVFSWINGEFAFGLLAVDNNSLMTGGLGGLVLIETSDRPTGENTLNKLKNVSRQLPYVQISEEDSQGISVTKWSTFQSPLLSYGWLNNQNLMLTLGTNFSTTQNINAQNSLANSENFKLTTQNLPKNNFGYVYFDAEKALDLYNKNIANQVPNSLPPEGEAIANSIKGIALTSSLINPKATQVDLMLTIKTNKK